LEPGNPAMNAINVAPRRMTARMLLVSILAGIVAACSGVGASTHPASVEPSATPTASASTTVVATHTPRPATYPTGRFADISEGPVTDAMAAKLQAILETMAGEGGITATVMTARGTWSGAFGKADGVHDVEVTSQFGIASVTKSIVAAQVMQLVEAGEIALDRAATEYLAPGFAFDTNGATIRQLLSMRSGIPDWYGDATAMVMKSDRSRAWTTDDVLALVPSARTAPGTTFEYADTNYTVLGLVLEHVRKRPLVEVLRDGVLRVKGTERLVYQPDEAPSDPMAMPSGESRAAVKAGKGFLPSLSDASSAGPAGSIASDSISLARWWRAFCAGEVVSQASVTTMSTFFDGPTGYGLGLFNQADPWGFGIGHTGGNFGFSSWAGCMTKAGVVVVVLTNQSIDDLGGLPRPLVEAASG
jgi:D-alanyl-D-alanine carboxypeptidase